MTPKPWEDWADEELANEAQAGVRGQGATVEAIRRLREAVRKEQRATTILTWVLVGFAVIQAALTLLPPILPAIRSYLPR